MEDIRIKSTLSGRSTPRDSPRVYSVRTPLRESRGSSRIVYWLLLITLWTYLGFYIQSRWAHDNQNKIEFVRFGGKLSNNVLHVGSDALENITINDEIEIGSESKKEDKPSRRSLKKRRSREVEVKDLSDDLLPMTNATYSNKLLGPFGLIEDRVLGWSPNRRLSTCDRKLDFKRLVWSRRFVLVFHELSLTGAPISMMELASELLSCGATVNAVVLTRRGGLMEEMNRRRIKVVEDKGEVSFKAAMKADLVIAGSAVCSSWIDQYMNRFPSGGSRIVLWIMENRREYFDRAKPVVNRVKLLVFLSELQRKQWLTWCDEESIKVRSKPVIVPLSVNDELAFVSGIGSSLNTVKLSTEVMSEKRVQLRERVRGELGLKNEDMLVMSLSSINPTKGQLLILQSVALALVEREKEGRNSLLRKHHLRGSSREVKSVELENGVRRPKQEVKLLLGSVGSKSNKVGYVKEMLSFLSSNGNLSKSVMWTPATTRVASLYSAADVYVTNSQGVGETFGRVTIEAMAYGLAVVGTDAGGTKEIVEHNVTGLLHSVGRLGSKELARNLLFLLRNPDTRQQFGIRGRKKVEKMYMKEHMYKRFIDVLVKCMRP